MSETKKFDGEKPALAFLPTEPLEEVAEILDFGAEKYGRNNWQIGTSWMRFASAALRHLFAWIRGEDLDPETGKSHLAHAACNLLFLMWYQRHGKGEDDRQSVSE